MNSGLGPSLSYPPLCLADTDWLHHRLTVGGPAETVAAFAASAQGAGTIPWSLDAARVEEDLFHRLIAPPAPQRRSLSLEGARALARQLTEASVARHEAALARVGISRACAFDLHALLPVPPDILRLGLTPLYTRFADMWAAAAALAAVLAGAEWARPEYRTRAAVT